MIENSAETDSHKNIPCACSKVLPAAATFTRDCEQVFSRQACESRLLPDRTDGLFLEATVRGELVNTTGVDLSTTIQLRADQVLARQCTKPAWGPLSAPTSIALTSLRI
jgi:hypothetical protein